MRVPENAPSPRCMTLSVPWIIVSGYYQKVHSPMNSTVSDNVTSRTPDSTKRCRRWQIPASPGFLREWPTFRPRLRRRIEQWTLQGHSPPVRARSPAAALSAGQSAVRALWLSSLSKVLRNLAHARHLIHMEGAAAVAMAALHAGRGRLVQRQIMLPRQAIAQAG